MGISIQITSNHTADITEAIEFLNLKAGTRFSTATKKYRDLLDVIFKEGYTIRDIKDVVIVKTEEWQNDARMKRYLRPSTLFNRNKFDEYMEQVALNSSGNTDMFNLLKDDWNE